MNTVPLAYNNVEPFDDSHSKTNHTFEQLHKRKHHLNISVVSNNNFKGLQVFMEHNLLNRNNYSPFTNLIFKLFKAKTVLYFTEPAKFSILVWFTD